jgi:hypothetical protein
MKTKSTELTKLGLDSLMPAEVGQRFEIADTVVPGLLAGGFKTLAGM